MSYLSKCENMLSSVIDSEKNRKLFCKQIHSSIKNLSSDDEQREKLCLWATYQIVGLMLENKEEMKTYFSDVKNGKICWESKIYDGPRSRLEEHDDYIVNPFEVVDGVLECPKCHSTKTYSIQKQTRSSDEPMTTFSKCAKCGHNWRYSG